MKGYKNEITEVQRLQGMMGLLLTLCAGQSQLVRHQIREALAELDMTNEESTEIFKDQLELLKSDKDEETIEINGYGIIVETVSGFKVRGEDYSK